MIHGTNGVDVENNVLHDIRGHGIFTEDGSERRNSIHHNLVLNVQNKPTWDSVTNNQNHGTKRHETGADGRGASGFWIANPDNVVTENAAGDCRTNGFWLSFAPRVFGLSGGSKVEGAGTTVPEFPESPTMDSTVPMRPWRMKLGVFDGNIAFCNGMEGINLDWVELPQPYSTVASDGAVPFDETGFVGQSVDVAPDLWNYLRDVENENDPGVDYKPCVHDHGGSPQVEIDLANFLEMEEEAPPIPVVANKTFSFRLSNCSTWKNAFHGMWNRSHRPWFHRYVSADNCGRYFAGDSTQGVISSSLVVCDSLNVGHSRPADNGEVRPAAFATYHSTLDIVANIAVGFTYFQPMSTRRKSNGVFSLDDYYLRPVELGHRRNVGNWIADSDPGYKLEAKTNFYPLAGAIRDYQRTWSDPPLTGNDERYWVYDKPFFNPDHGTVPEKPEGILREGPYYGVAWPRINLEDELHYERKQYIKMAVHRVEPLADAPVPGASWGIDSPFVPDDTHEGNPSMGNPDGSTNETAAPCTEPLLAHFQDFAALKGYEYHVDLEGYTKVLEGPCDPEWQYVEGFPASTPAGAVLQDIKDLSLEISNMHTSDDVLVLRIHFSGDLKIEECYVTTRTNPLLSSNQLPYGGNRHDVLDNTPPDTAHPDFASHVLDEVVKLRGTSLDPTECHFVHDVVNDALWVRLRGGVATPSTDCEEGPGLDPCAELSDAKLYNKFALVVRTESNGG